MNFCDWIEINEIKAPKKAKITVVAHSDIDRWLKSVDGFARDLQDLKKAKEKSQTKLDQIKKKYEPEPEKPVEKAKPDRDQNQKKDQDQDQKATVLKPKEKESPDDKELIQQSPRGRVPTRVRKPKPAQPEVEADIE